MPDTTTQPYDNGAIPFIPAARRPKRQKRPLVWDQAAENDRQRRQAMQNCETAHRVWRSKGGRRFGQPEPKLEDFLPEHLKAADQPQGLKPVLQGEDDVSALDEDTEAGEIAPLSPPAAAQEEDDSQVPGLGTAPRKTARKAPQAKKPEIVEDDTMPEIEIPT